MNDVKADCGLFGPGFYGNRKILSEPKGPHDVTCAERPRDAKVKESEVPFSLGMSRMSPSGDVQRDVTSEDWIELMTS